MTSYTAHRLDGLEPDNLLAFLTLLGLLRTLEEVRPEWHPRVFWTVDEPPLRPALRVTGEVDQTSVAESAAEGLNQLISRHDFGDLKDIKLPKETVAETLRSSAKNAEKDPYVADLWASLVSDAVIDDHGKSKPTPLCLLGTGQTSFVKNFQAAPKLRTPPKRGGSGKKIQISEIECLCEALFSFWQRPDDTPSFRWDPHEDVRHAQRRSAPTDQKETTQHGANRLAAIGLSVLTVVPRQRASGKTYLQVLCRSSNSDHSRAIHFGWPVWREPVSLPGIRALLSHPDLDRPSTRAALGVVELRRAKRISVGKYMNVTRAQAVPELE